MATLKEMLLQEQARLEHILQKTTEQLKDVPQGTLRISSSGKWTQYYHCTPGGRRNGTYIPKNKERLIRELAQKSYDKKVLKLVQRRLSQLRTLTREYEDEELEQIYLKENPEKQKLIQPAEPTWAQRLAAWEEKDYIRKEFREDIPVILTERGERVRSKSEKILADYFYQNGIPYKYERPLYLKGFGTVHPDFTFLSKKSGSEIYWEHDGRIDDPGYAQNAVKKILAYEDNGIFPGERLILTFETEKTILDTRLIKRLVSRYLL